MTDKQARATRQQARALALLLNELMTVTYSDGVLTVKFPREWFAGVDPTALATVMNMAKSLVHSFAEIPPPPAKIQVRVLQRLRPRGRPPRFQTRSTSARRSKSNERAQRGTS